MSTKASPPNPLENTHASSLRPVSSVTYPIAGILTTVHGLSELPSSVQELAVLWLLHPRLGTQERMAPMASQAIHHWNSRNNGKATKGLIAVSFDQRNHGTRLVDKLANEAWRQGNERHAQDMYSVYHGTAVDTSLLISYLPSYLPTPIASLPSQHLVLGVSLGGHAAWHCLLQDPRITAGVVIIGCPDFRRLMLQRAEKSRRKAFGAKFLGSSDLPEPLLREMALTDPAGTGLPEALQGKPHDPVSLKVDAAQVDASTDGVPKALAGKSILNLSGGADKLVPYACGETFLRCLKMGIESKTGVWRDSKIVLDDRIFEGVGHEMTPAMADVAVGFIGDVLDGTVRKGRSVRESKI